MAYPTVSVPYGLKAVNSIDGKPYAGALRQIPMASGYTATYFGDAVKIVNGYLDKDTGTTAATPCGVFVGGSYSNSLGQPVYSQYLPAGATNPVGYVIDDQPALFAIARNAHIVDLTGRCAGHCWRGTNTHAAGGYRPTWHGITGIACELCQVRWNIEWYNFGPAFSFVIDLAAVHD